MKSEEWLTGVLETSGCFNAFLAGKSRKKPSLVVQFRLRSKNKELISKVAEMLGGAVKAKSDARLILSETSELVTIVNHLHTHPLMFRNEEFKTWVQLIKLKKRWIRPDDSFREYAELLIARLKMMRRGESDPKLDAKIERKRVLHFGIHDAMDRKRGLVF